MGVPSMCKVFTGLDDSYVLRLMTLCFLLSTSTGFLYIFFCYVDTIIKGNILINLSITDTFAKDVPNSLEIIANRSSSKTFFFLVKLTSLTLFFNSWFEFFTMMLINYDTYINMLKLWPYFEIVFNWFFNIKLSTNRKKDIHASAEKNCSCLRYYNRLYTYD